LKFWLQRERITDYATTPYSTVEFNTKGVVQFKRRKTPVSHKEKIAVPDLSKKGTDRELQERLSLDLQDLCRV